MNAKDISVTGNALIKELSISKADLVRACLGIGLPVFGVDILQREFSLDEVARVKRKVGSFQPDDSGLASKSKKRPKIKRPMQKTPRYFATEFQVDIEEVFALAKSFGFAIRNENCRLTERQVAVLEEQLISREDAEYIEMRLENLEAGQNSSFAIALMAAMEARDLSKGAEPKKSGKDASFVATSKRLKLVANENGVSEELSNSLCVAVGIPVISTKKSLKIDVQYLDQLLSTIAVLKEVQQYKSADEKVRISKIAKLFGVQAKEVRDLCEANDITVLSERFIDGVAETIILVLLQLKINSEGGVDLAEDAVVANKPNVSKTASVDYSGLSLTRQNIHDYNFSKSVMHEVDFSYSKLSALSFRQSQMQRSIFVQVEIKNSNFDAANLQFSNLDFVRAENVDFNNANLSDCSFNRAILKNCRFSGADLSRCNFQDAKFENCDFSKSIVVNTKGTDGILVQSCGDLTRYGTN
jgi:uncharacterized protein YjbI with pentapeptide repeats